MSRRRIDPNSSAFEAYDHLRDCIDMARGVAGQLQMVLALEEAGSAAPGELEKAIDMVRPLLNRLDVAECILRRGVLGCGEGEVVPTEEELHAAREAVPS